VEEMKRKYEITGMPTVIFLDPSGEEITRFTGFKTASDLLAMMDDSGL
jgi:thioredoxin-related protein